MLDADVDKINKAQVAITLAFKENAIEMDHSCLAALLAIFVVNCIRMNLDPYDSLSEVIFNLSENVMAGAKFVNTKINQVQ